MIILAASDEMSKAGFTFYNNCDAVCSGALHWISTWLSMFKIGWHSF